jgi:hypothetical protein
LNNCIIPEKISTETPSQELICRSEVASGSIALIIGISAAVRVIRPCNTKYVYLYWLDFFYNKQEILDSENLCNLCYDRYQEALC